MEQYIRAERAQELGLVRMLADSGNRPPSEMAQALRALPDQSRPSEVHIPGALDGLSVINGLVDQWLNRRATDASPLSLVK